jgi:hypothetical protein
MTFHQFQDFVAANIDWFRGRFPETDSSLARVEQVLGVELPRSLKWLLKEHGYWHGTGISNLEDTERETLDAREALALPKEFVVIENLQDGGVVLIDTSELALSGESPLYWVGPEDLGNPPRLEGNTRFASFGNYVQDRLPSVQDFIEPQHVRYDPADFPEGRRGDG